MARARRGNDSLARPARGTGQRRREVYIFTEGKVTEPGYLDIVRESGLPKDPALQVDMHIMNRKLKSDRKPLDLVDMAVALKREKDREAKRAKVTLKSDLRPQFWCVFDHDNYPHLAAAMKQAKDDGIEVAFSHPCFEVWRLAHYQVVNGRFSGVCGGAAGRLPFAPGTVDAKDPKVVLPHQIVGRYETAKKNAEQMNGRHGEQLQKIDRDPYTDVYALVERGLGISTY
ncbi:RloB family protein [Streptomyces sp. NBC_01197]|uniref:RloB family protein n=1 Tax=Streptomyces sp. NBC_01197 TaxID=2903768 RepID=UPI002E110294|nr:RloB family protein [Streptomyces sp. NBC_01197]